MAGNSRDVTLTLSVETLGEDGIGQLQDALKALAKESGAAGPEFQRLADEVARLGEQNAALQSFKALADATETLRAKQESAANTAQEMAAKLETLRAATEASRAKQQEASQALIAGQTAYVEAGNAIRVLKTEYDNAGKNTAEYRDALKALTVEQGEAKTALIALRQSQKDANTEVGQAEAAQRKLETQYARSATQAQKAADALKSQVSALDESSKAAQELGVSTDNIADAEGRLVAAFNKAVTTARERSAAIKDTTEADRLLAIEQQSMLALLAKGEAALQAEVLAQRDAARATKEYEEAKQAATAANAAWQREADELVAAAESAQRLARETEILTATQRELVALRAFEQQAEDARKLVQAAEYVRFWETSLTQAEAQVKQTADAAAQAAGRIDTAFKTLGVRSAQDLQLEIANVRASMATVAATSGSTGAALSGAFAAGEAKIKLLEREMRELNGTLTMGDKAAKLFKNSMGQIAVGNLVADAIGALVERVKQMGREFIIAIVQMDQMRRGLNAIYKDAGTTASQINFLRQTASAAGVSFGGLSAEFVRFSASMHGANVPMAQSNELFKAVVQASANLGLGAEATAGSLNALAQMASKGVVSMEELRQQLGDRLPGALGLVAKGLGITEADLIKLVEAGNLAARDMFPALTQALKEMGGEAEGLVPTWERLKGLFTQFSQDIGDAGAITLLTGALKLLGGVVGSLAMGLSVLGESMFLVGAAAVALTARLSGDTNAWAFYAEQVAKSTERLTEQGRALVRVASFQQQSTDAQEAATVAMGAAAAAAVTATNAATGSAKALELQALAAKLAKDGVYGLEAQYVQFALAATKALALQQEQTQASEKMAKAAKIEGDSLVALAVIAGDRNAQLQTNIAASQKYAAALAEVAEGHKTELELLQVSLKELISSAEKRGLDAKAIEVQRAELEKKIKATEADVEASKQAAEAARRLTEANRLAAETYRNNAARMDEYKAALVAATQVLAEYERLHAQGKKTDEEVAAARERVAQAQALYNDALKDSVEQIDREMRAKTASIAVTQAKAAAEQQSYQLLAQSAKATGDYTLALHYEIEAKRAQIEVTKATFEIKKLEAQADLAALEVKKLEIPVTDALRKEKLEELDIRIKLAKAKLVEAGAGKDVVAAMEREISAMISGNSARGREVSGRGAVASATNSQTDAMDKLLMKYTMSADYSERQIALLEREAAAAERAAEAKRKYWNVDKEGFTLNTAGQRAEQTIQSRRSVFEQAKTAGLTEEEAMDIAKRFINDSGRYTGWNKMSGKTWQETLQQAIDKKLMEAAEKRINQPAAPTATTGTAGGGTSSTATTPASPTSSSSGMPPPTATGVQTGSKTINLQINGGPTTSLRGLSSDNAEKITGFMRELESAKGTAQ